MIKELSKKHEHTWNILRFRTFTWADVTNQDFHGHPGDKAMILAICSCGDEQGVDYGPTPLMMKRFKEMREAKQK